MSDNPQDVNPGDPSGEGGSGQAIAPGVSRKERPQKAGQQPTFDDVMRAASAPPPVKNAVVVKRAQPVSQPAKAQPSFEEIMAGVTVSPEQAQAAAANSPPPPASQPPPQQSRPPRAQRKEKDARRMPLVVRKPALPRPGDAAPRPEASEGASAEGQEKGDGSPAGPSASAPAPARAPQPLAESVYARPSADENADFAALFAEQQSQQPRHERVRPGAKVKAKVVHLGAEVAFLDMGGKGEGIIDLRELRDEKGSLEVGEGGEIDGYVLSMGEGTVVITRSVPKGAGREVLQEALQSRVPVEGTVVAVNKGGLEIDLGGQRAFCPASQIDVRFVDDTSSFVGQKLKFLVQEIRGGNAILSRRAILEEERKEQAAELRKKLEVGAVLEGAVTSVRDFGAFVDLGGLEGLVHVSELSHARVAHAQDLVKPGQRVRVQVLRIDPPGKDAKGVLHKEERVALSLRALEQDPWDAARPQLEEGKKLQGKVARLQPFGAFVELFPGVDGLVHVSALSSRHVSHPREVVKEGETIWVQVESVDDGSKRVALRRITEEEAQSPDPVPAPQRTSRERGEKTERGEGAPRGPRAKVGDMVDAKVERVEPFGVFVVWAAGKGLVPNAELGTPRGSDNKKTTPVGTEFKAQIIEVDDRGRFRLSRTSAERAVDRADYERYQRANTPAGKGLGTLGDLIRAKMQQRALDED
jgi:small subunit ribosomal protein S1